MTRSAKFDTADSFRPTLCCKRGNKYEKLYYDVLAFDTCQRGDENAASDVLAA